MPKVEVNKENFDYCRCPVCPVQVNSQCAKKKNEEIEEPTEGKEMARLYCAIGVSACDDIEGEKPCICATCEVWQKNGLGSWHYCVKGSSQEVEG